MDGIDKAALECPAIVVRDIVGRVAGTAGMIDIDTITATACFSIVT